MTGRSQRVTAVLAVLARYKVQGPRDVMRQLAEELVTAAAPEVPRWERETPIDRPCQRCGERPRDGAHTECKTCIRGRLYGGAESRRAAAGSPAEGPSGARPAKAAVVSTPPAAERRTCRMCGEAKPVEEFAVKFDKRSPRFSSRCRDCLNTAARGRYLSAKKLAALNAVRIEVVADDEMAGLRCRDCGELIVAGDEVVCEAGLAHLGCDEGAGQVAS